MFQQHVQMNVQESLLCTRHIPGFASFGDPMRQALSHSHLQLRTGLAYDVVEPGSTHLQGHKPRCHPPQKWKDVAYGACRPQTAKLPPVWEIKECQCSQLSGFLSKGSRREVPVWG